MDSKAFAFFNTVYRYFQVSFYFWINLLKGAIIYSLVPAFSALLLTMRELNKEEEEEQQVKVIFSKHFYKFNQYKFISFIYSLVIITSFSSLYLLNRLETSYALILTVLVIYILIMTVLLLTYTAFYLGNHDMKVKQTLIMSFVSMIRNFGKSIMVLIFIIILLILAYYNFFLFIIIAPFLYGISVNGSLHSLLNEK